MTNKKYLAAIILAIVAVFYAVKCAKTGHDFEVFVNAGNKIVNDLNIYKPPFVQDLNYYYSPLFALLLAPFSTLPTIIPQLLWIFFSYFLLYRTWILSMEYFDTLQLTQKQQQWWLGITLVLSSRFILFDISHVQMTIFLLWATLQSIQWVQQGKNLQGAALLAFAINIKLLPLAFLAYLFYRKKFKGALFTCLFYVIYLYIPALYLGWERNASLLHDWFSIINPANKEWSIEAEDGPSSLVALIPVYLTDTSGVLSFKRNFINLNLEQVTLILNIVRLAFVLLTLAFLRTLPFKSISSKVRQYWEMCYLFIAVPLIFPHQQVYAFMYITPTFLYLAWYFVSNWTAVKSKMNYFAWAVLIIIGFNFTPLIGRDVISSHFYQVLLYLRILPVAVILLIPILWICRPKEELVNKTL